MPRPTLFLALAALCLAPVVHAHGEHETPPPPGPTADDVPPPPASEPPTRPAPGTPEDAARREKVLMRLGERVLTVGAFEDELSSDAVPPPVRASFANPERVAEEFRRRADRMALAAYARRLGLTDRTDVAREVRKLLRGVTLHRRSLEAVTESSVTDADVQAYYDGHSDLYNRPEMATAGIILLADRPAAEAALARAMAAQGNRADLTRLVRELSQDADTKRRAGNLGVFDREGRPNRVAGSGPAERIDPAVVAAAFALTEPFAVHPQVVETARGPAVVFLLNRSPAVTRALAEVASRIRLQLLDERRETARSAYVEEVRARRAVRVNDAAFDKVVVAPGDPGPMLPTPGGIGDLPGPAAPVGPPRPLLTPPVAPLRP